MTCPELPASKWQSWGWNSGCVAAKPKFLAAALKLCFMHLSWRAAKCLTHAVIILFHRVLTSCREGGKRAYGNSKPGMSDWIHVVQGYSWCLGLFFNSSIIIYLMRAFLTLVNPEANELSIVVSDERTLPLLDDLVLSVSNAVPVGNHSRYTSYAGCFGLLHCHHEIPGEAGSQRTFQRALCFICLLYTSDAADETSTV